MIGFLGHSLGVAFFSGLSICALYLSLDHFDAAVAQYRERTGKICCKPTESNEEVVVVVLNLLQPADKEKEVEEKEEEEEEVVEEEEKIDKGKEPEDE